MTDDVKRPTQDEIRRAAERQAAIAATFASGGMPVGISVPRVMKDAAMLAEAWLAEHSAPAPGVEAVMEMVRDFAADCIVADKIDAAQRMDAIQSAITALARRDA